MSIKKLMLKFIEIIAYNVNIIIVKNTEYDVLLKIQNQLVKYKLADEVATKNRHEYFETLPLS